MIDPIDTELKTRDELMQRLLALNASIDARLNAPKARTIKVRRKSRPDAVETGAPAPSCAKVESPTKKTVVHNSPCPEPRKKCDAAERYVAPLEPEADWRAANRAAVVEDIAAAAAVHRAAALASDPGAAATHRYVYPNQENDAQKVVDMFCDDNIQVVTAMKLPKVGADGFMIWLAKLMTSHEGEGKMLRRENIAIATAMSSLKWESDLRAKAPEFLKPRIFHHGNLKLFEDWLDNRTDALVMVDEADCGDGVEQKLHTVLRRLGLMDVKEVRKRNIRFVYVSATLQREMKEFAKWSDEVHRTIRLDVPANYIGQAEFLERGIIREFYPVDTYESAVRWVTEDIVQNYGSDHRVHFIRARENTKTDTDCIKRACAAHGVLCVQHNSAAPLSDEAMNAIYRNTAAHTVIVVKGLMRRSTEIANWQKLRIGAMHERFTKSADASVQTQAFPGRLSGFWRDILDGGHKVGPIRTAISAVKQHIAWYADPGGDAQYDTAPRKVLMSPNNVENLELKPELPGIVGEKSRGVARASVYDPNAPAGEHVPVLIQVDHEATHAIMMAASRDEKLTLVLARLAKDPTQKELHAFIMGPRTRLHKITTPYEEDSYNISVVSIARAAKNGAPCVVGLSARDKLHDNWQLYNDVRAHRWCFVLWTAPALA